MFYCGLNRKINYPHSTLHPSDVRMRAAYPIDSHVPYGMLNECPMAIRIGCPWDEQKQHPIDIHNTSKYRYHVK
jgi:hypothetical protein